MFLMEPTKRRCTLKPVLEFILDGLNFKSLLDEGYILISRQFNFIYTFIIN